MKKTQVPTKKKKSDDSHWKIGNAYFIRTVTHHYTGRLIKVTPKELVIEDAAWIADDGRFTQFVAGGEANEVEPYPNGAEVIIGRGRGEDLFLEARDLLPLVTEWRRQGKALLPP